MLDDTTAPDLTPARPGLSRRQVVKAGAHSAWAVPLITIATAAPALAVSGQGSLVASRFTAYYEKNRNHFRLNLGPIKNTGSGTTGQVTVVFRVPQPQQYAGAAPRLVGPKPKGWSYAGSGSYPGGWTFTFVSAADLDPGESTPLLNARFKFTAPDNCTASQVSATATASNATPAAASATLACPPPKTPRKPNTGGNSGDGNGYTDEETTSPPPPA